MARDRHGSETIGSIEAARLAGITLRQLYYWMRVFRAVHPQVRRHGRRRFRHFTVEDVRRLTAIRRQLDRGFTLQAAVKAASRS